MEAVLSRELIVVNAYIKEEESFQISSLISHLEKLGKPKLSEGRT